MDEKLFKNYTRIFLFVFFFIGILGVFKPAYDYTLVKNVIGYFFCLMSGIVFLFAKKNFSFHKTTLIIFLGFFFWLLISALLSQFKYDAFAYLENVLLYFLVFIIGANLKLEKDWIYFWLISSFIAGIMAISQYFGFSNYIGVSQYLWKTRYPTSTFGNPNFFAGHFLMPFLIGISLLNQKKFWKGEKFFLISFITIGVISILITKSRAAIFAFLVGVSFFFFFSFKENFLKKWAGFFFLFILLLLLSHKIHTWIFTNIRYYIWRGTWNLIKSNLFLGYGPGNFIFHYPKFRIREYFLQPESTPVTNHSHCEYLELWSEIGLIGLFLFLGLVFLVIFLSIKNKKVTTVNGIKKRKVEETYQGTLPIGFTCGIIAVLFDNIFSTNLRNPSTAIYFWFSLGILLSSIENKENYNLLFSRILWSVVSIVSFIMIVFFSYYRILSSVYLKKGIVAKEEGREWEEKGNYVKAQIYYNEAIKNYSVACYINPYNYEVWYKLAYVYGTIGKLEEAKKIYLYINNYLFPHFAKTDSNLATVYRKEGKIEESLNYYKKAEWFNPYDKDILCGIASIYLTYYHDNKKAKEYLERVLKIDPNNMYANNVLQSLKKHK